MVAVVIFLVAVSYLSTVGSQDAHLQQCIGRPLGMSNGMIRNDQISASSHDHHAHNARLHGEKAWRAESTEDWIQVDLERFVYVAGLATQGRQGGDEAECVTRYKVSYGTTADTEEDELQYITDEENEEQIFHGNHNRNDPVYSAFSMPVLLRFIRIEPTDCKNRCSLRFELYGCEVVQSGVITTTRKPRTYPVRVVTSRKVVTSRNVNVIATRAARLTTVTSPSTSSKLQLSSTKPTSRNGDSLPAVFPNANPTRTPFRRLTTSKDRRLTTSKGRRPTTSKEHVFSQTPKSLLGLLGGADPVGAREEFPTVTVAGVAGCVLVVLIALVVAAVWFYRRKRSSPASTDDSKQVMQLIGPYEPTSPGPVPSPIKGESKQAMQQIGPYEPTMPVGPVSSPNKADSKQVMQQIGPYEPSMPGPLSTANGGMSNKQQGKNKEGPKTSGVKKAASQSVTTTGHKSAAQQAPGHINYKPSVMNRTSYKIANLADWEDDHLYAVDN